jgi:Xaa-Pro aminopeptidase
MLAGQTPAQRTGAADNRLAPGSLPNADRPFGMLRDQAAMQQAWLKKRLDTFLPALMRKHGIDMWVVPMREYNEDPIFSSIAAPETFYARRRTIYVFFDKCAVTGTAVGPACVERIALGGTSQGGVFQSRSSMKSINAATGARQAELWGDEQWLLLKEVVEERKPKVIGIDRSTVFAFSDGLSSGELQGMTDALGGTWTSKFRNAERLPLELIASRLPDEEAFFEKMTALVWQMTHTMFSEKVIVPGTTHASDLVWWWRQRTNDQGLGTWFQPSVSVQRKGATAKDLGDDPIIQPGDVLHCDVGITVARLNTDTQHLAYVLRPGETDAPAGLKQALANANAMQDFAMEEIRPGRTGNEILGAVLARMKARGISGTMYSHPIGLNGHGAGPLIGLWDYQDGVVGRGEAKVIPSMWFSIELQATTPVAEWGGQPVQMAQEEDAIIDASGRIRWAKQRQDALFLVRSAPRTQPPDPDHARLVAMSGSWDVEMTFWLQPGRPGLSTRGTSTIRPLLNGQFVEETIEGVLSGSPFTTLAWTGFNTATHQYEATRIASTNSIRIAESGTYDAATNRFELKAEYPLAGDTWRQRTVIEPSSAETMTAASYLSFGTVPEWKAVEIKYTRRPSQRRPGDNDGQ